MIEHRCSRREAIEVAASLHQKGRFLATGTIRNVNQYGVFLETAKIVPKNTFIEVLFRLPDKQIPANYRLYAMVAHSSESGVGLYVDTLAPDSQNTLRSLLSHVKAKQLSNAA